MKGNIMTEQIQQQKKPQTLRSSIDVVPRFRGEAGTADAVPVVRQHDRNLADEISAAEAHHGRRLMADERAFFEPFITDTPGK
jgi:hypothetical protein